jgi:hypothetical protein
MAIQNGIKRAKRGLEDSTVTIVFPGQSTHPTVDANKWRNEIETVGTKALAGWGGMERLEACAQ